MGSTCGSTRAGSALRVWRRSSPCVCKPQFGLGLAAAVVAGVFAGLNLAWAAWRLRRVASKEDRDSRGMATIVAAVPLVAVIVGLGFGLAAFGQWQTWLGFQAQVPFGQTDPTFGQDIAFYVWTLPALTAAAGLADRADDRRRCSASLVVYALGLASIEPPIASRRPVPVHRPRTRPALSPAARARRCGTWRVLGAVFLVLVAASYWINNWELVYSTRGVVYGASATDMHAIYPANTIMAGVALVLAALLLLVAIRPTTGASTGFLVTAAAVPILWLGIGLRPRRALARPVRAGRRPPQPAGRRSDRTSRTTSSRPARAMDLDRIDVRDLSGDGTLDAGVLARNQPALADVRITDWRPLMAAYNQLQRIRQYYEFSDIDVDRYDVARRSPASDARHARARPDQPGAGGAHLAEHPPGLYPRPGRCRQSRSTRSTPQGLPVLLEQRYSRRRPTSRRCTIDCPRSISACGRRTTPWSAPDWTSSTVPATTPTAEIRTRYAGGGGSRVGGGLERLATAAALATATCC